MSDEPARQLDEERARRVARRAALVRLEGARGRARRRARRRGAERDDPPLLVARARRGALPGRHARALPAAARPAPGDEGWTEGVIARPTAGRVYDALADPAASPCSRPAAPTAPTSPPSTAPCASTGRRRGARPSRPTVRPMGAEQSNSSIVFDEALVAEGLPPRSSRATTPSSRCCASSPRTASRTSRALRGWYEYSGELMDATLGVAAGASSPARRDGWELALDELGRPRGVPRPPARARRGDRRRCTPSLGSDATDPDFAPEEPERRGARPARRRRSTRRSSGSSSTCPTTTRRSSRSPAAARRCATACSCSRTSASAGG